VDAGADGSWTGIFGAHGSHTTIYAGLAFQTVQALASRADQEQVARGHNLVAIWTLRVVLTGVERLGVPPVASISEIVARWVPSYYLWTTVLFCAMLLSEKTHDGERATSWYASWLVFE
jgi:hypothetical protein